MVSSIGTMFVHYPTVCVAAVEVLVPAVLLRCQLTELAAVTIKF